MLRNRAQELKKLLIAATVHFIMVVNPLNRSFIEERFDKISTK
ncbi:hypothetical protein [Neobacillus endophyticus]|nr:hypothetical protein [Neobacillus endophyticus]